MKRTILPGLLFLFSVSFFSCKEGQDKKEPVAETPVKEDVTAQWNLGVQLWTFHLYDLVTAIAKADSAGLKFIEAFPGQKLGGDFTDKEFGPRMSAESRAKVSEMLKSKGISLVGFGVVVPATKGEWDSTFAFARDMGIKYITAEPLKEHWGYADSLAGATGIKVSIHDHPRPSAYWHPDSVLAATKGHPNLGACADIGHWGRNGLDPVECLKKLEGHIVSLHFKDIKEMNKVDAGDMIPGTGVLNMPAIFAELKRQGFKGTLSIEHEDNWYNNVPDVKRIVEYYNAEVGKLK